jgi:SAM-dependent methyltransferase
VTRSLEAAFAALRSENVAPVEETLAPVYDALVAGVDDPYDDQAWIVDAELEDEAASILEVGCGVGGLLARLAADRDRVVGVDERGDALWFARQRTDAPVVRGDPAALPFDGEFGACVSLGCRTGRLEDPRAALAGAFDALAPGGRLVLDAPTEPSAVLEDRWDGAHDRYRLRRSVAAGEVSGDRARVAVEYSLSDDRTGDSVEASETLSIRLFEADDLASSLASLGFVDVEVTRNPGVDDAVLATASKPR